MSAASSLLLFWGLLGLLLLVTRRRPAEMVPDRDFSEAFKGLAMLFVIYHHCRIYLGSDFWYLALGGDAYAGVSMFFFASGLGLGLSQRDRPRPAVPLLRARLGALVPAVALCMVWRGLLGPLWGEPAVVETDPLTLMGLREWFLLALYVYYGLFCLSWGLGRDGIGRGFVLLIGCAMAAIGLVAAGEGWETGRLWWRFPFSFALGALAAAKAEDLFGFVRAHTWTVLALSGAVLGLAWAVKPQADLPMNWIADAAAIPVALAATALAFRSGLGRGLLSFLGRNSLALYLFQIPLLKHGLLLGHWRKDMLGLLATLALLALLAFGAGQARRLAGRLASWAAARLRPAPVQPAA